MCELQALVYDILPSATAVFSCAIGSRKLSANEEEGAGKRCSECGQCVLAHTAQPKEGSPVWSRSLLVITRLDLDEGGVTQSESHSKTIEVVTIYCFVSGLRCRALGESVDFRMVNL